MAAQAMALPFLPLAFKRLQKTRKPGYVAKLPMREVPENKFTSAIKSALLIDDGRPAEIGLKSRTSFSYLNFAQTPDIDKARQFA